MTRLTSLTVILPTEFTSHRMQRMFLTRRHATRMALPAITQARRALAYRAAPVAMLDVHEPAAFNWSALGSVLLMVIMVAVACWATGVRL